MIDMLIFGDITGDGKITLEDLMLLPESIQFSEYTGQIDLRDINSNAVAAADVDNSGGINNDDFIALLDHVFGKKIITYVAGINDEGDINLFNSTILTNAGFVLNSNGYYVGKVNALHNTYGGINNSLPLPEFKPDTQYKISFEGYTEIEIPKEYGGFYIRIYYTDNTFTDLILSETINSVQKVITPKNKNVLKICGTYGAHGDTNVYIKNFIVCNAEEDI